MPICKQWECTESECEHWRDGVCKYGSTPAGVFIENLKAQHKRERAAWKQASNKLFGRLGEQHRQELEACQKHCNKSDARRLKEVGDLAGLLKQWSDWAEDVSGEDMKWDKLPGLIDDTNRLLRLNEEE